MVCQMEPPRKRTGRDTAMQIGALGGFLGFAGGDVQSIFLYLDLKIIFRKTCNCDGNPVSIFVSFLYVIGWVALCACVIRHDAVHQISNLIKANSGAVKR